MKPSDLTTSISLTLSTTSYLYYLLVVTTIFDPIAAMILKAPVNDLFVSKNHTGSRGRIRCQI